MKTDLSQIFSQGMPSEMKGLGNAQAVDAAALEAAGGGQDFMALLQSLGQANSQMPGLDMSAEEVLNQVDALPDQLKFGMLDQLKEDLHTFFGDLKAQGEEVPAEFLDQESVAAKVDEIIKLVKTQEKNLLQAFQELFSVSPLKKFLNAKKKVSAIDVPEAKLLKQLNALTKNSMAANQKLAPANIAQMSLKNQNTNPIQSDQQVLDSQAQLSLLNAHQKTKSLGKQGAFANSMQYQNKLSSGQEGVIKGLNELDQSLMTQEKTKNDLSFLKNMNKSANVQSIMQNEENGQNLGSGPDQNGQQNQGQLNFINSMQMPAMGGDVVAEGDDVFTLKAAGVDGIDVKAQNLENNRTSQKLIKDISTYIEKARFDGQKELDLSVSHRELGQFDIHVSKEKLGNNLDLQIKAAQSEGLNFFQENEAELVRSLNEKGIRLSNLKVSAKGEASIGLSSSGSGLEKQESGFMDQGRDQNHQQNNHQKSSGFSQKDGQHRRQELWQKAREGMMPKNSSIGLYQNQQSQAS